MQSSIAVVSHFHFLGDYVTGVCDVAGENDLVQETFILAGYIRNKPTLVRRLTLSGLAKHAFDTRASLTKLVVFSCRFRFATLIEVVRRGDCRAKPAYIPFKHPVLLFDNFRV